MILQFRLGLKSVQDDMANHPEPTTFAEFSQLAIDVDNRQYGSTITRSGNKFSGTHAAPPLLTPQLLLMLFLPQLQFPPLLFRLPRPLR